MKRAMILALLMLVGCDPALWQRKPMTPEQQRAYEIKRSAQVLVISPHEVVQFHS